MMIGLKVWFHLTNNQSLDAWDSSSLQRDYYLTDWKDLVMEWEKWLEGEDTVSAACT